jgi:hypothetical protein
MWNKTIYNLLLKDPLRVSRGQITFDAEGNDDPSSPYYSRKPHVPSSRSGITIGRGYDLKLRSKSQVDTDLVGVGIPGSIAQKFSDGVGLEGQAARDYLKVNDMWGKGWEVGRREGGPFLFNDPPSIIIFIT